jgi:alpha-galactosidase
MPVTIQRDACRLRAATDELELEVDLATLALELASRRAGVRIAGARPCAVVDGRRRFAAVPRLDGHGEIRTRLGVATRIQLRAASDDGLELALAVDLADGWPGIALELALENRGEGPRVVESLDALAWERGPETALDLPGAHALAFFRLGYQSWSPARWTKLGEREPRARLDLVRRIACGPHTPQPGPGLHLSDFAAVLRAPGEAGLTLGFLTHERFLAHVALESDPLGVRSLAARLPTEGAAVAPHETLRAERLWVGLDAPGADGLAGWAERCGLEMSAPVPARVPSGWCSWYHYFTRVTAADVEKNVEALAPLAGVLDAIQIDDGWQAAVGDWESFSPGFPDGVAPLARRIRDAGFRAGIWLAPFLVSRASRTAREHPEWLLRGADGRPIVAMVNPGWKGKVCHALDPTHPDAIAWLARVIATLHAQGFDWFKLDFLYAAALPGAHHVRLPGAAAYRRGIGALREAARDAFFVGCGAPLGPSVGLFDAMRIGPDVAPTGPSARSTA